MPASELGALLAAVHAAPADDAPRLILADWLDDNGHPERAEFIRIQVEMKRVRTENGRLTPRADELFVRQRELFRQDWARPIREFGSKVIGVYSRGFAADSFTLRADQFLRHGPALISWFGPASRVTLGDFLPDLTRAANRPELGAVPRFALIVRPPARTPTPPTGVAELLRGPYLGGLRELTIADHDMTRRLAEVLCEAASLRHLEFLDVGGNRLGTAGLLFLADNPRFSHLKSLHLRDTGVTDRTVRSLVESPHLCELEELVVGPNDVTQGLRRRLPPDRRRVLRLVGE